MNTRAKVWCVAVVLFAPDVLNVTCKSHSTFGPQSERDTVRAVAEGIIAADNAGDLDRVLGYYAADAMLLPPNERPVKGLAAIRPRYNALFRSYKVEITPTIEEIEVSGPLAYVLGYNGGRLIARDGGTSRPIHDAYLMLLKRSPNGDWHISRLMWSSTVSEGSGKTNRQD